MRILLAVIIIVLSLSNVGLWIQHEFVVSDVKNLKRQVQEIQALVVNPHVKEPSSPNKTESTKPTSPLQSPPPSTNPTKKPPTSKKTPVKDFECINRNDC
ncbi:MAG TPA: hypothetical protein VEP90_10245 [Methylomirabilota bacterium]|nr:hypothetical protein [Methylomirabilota bacterium]